MQLLFFIRTNQPEHKYALLNWPLPWPARKKYSNKYNLKQSCTCTTLKAILNWWTLAEKQIISWSCAVFQNKVLRLSSASVCSQHALSCSYEKCFFIKKKRVYWSFDTSKERANWAINKLRLSYITRKAFLNNFKLRPINILVLRVLFHASHAVN